VDPYLQLLVLVALLFFLPKLLVKVGLPSPVTEMALGLFLGPTFLGWVEPSELLFGLAGFGISALFLFAGLEVEVRELIERRGPLLQHLFIQLVLFGAAIWVGTRMNLEFSPAVLVAVAVMTSSVGFIVPALEALGIPSEMASWIKQKAISTELLAIATVLLFSNTASMTDLFIGLGGITALIGIVPLLFLGYHNTILKWAPRTEFSFVMIVALLAAYVTHHLGVHYLVGAFLVGFIARRYLRWCSKQGVEVAGVRAALGSFRFFSAFFVPFFFFLAGATLPEGALTLKAAGFALSLAVLATPLRAGSVMLHRRYSLKESWGEAWKVGLLLGPTTVFSVAIAEILRQRFPVEGWIVGGLILYGAFTSLLPMLTHMVKSTEYEDIINLDDVFAGGGR
jgi:Kef-type K+ transport system membrane component KefB